MRKGYLRREPRKARGLAIIREPEDEVSDMVPVLIVGEVTAGQERIQATRLLIVAGFLEQAN